jgi:cytoskeleton protein RodZ
MTESTTAAAGQASAPEGGHAGALLRAARQQQGLHIAALAASIKVTPAKLEALEAGRYHELPDATFTRALALTVCRVLKIDATPVLAQLPGAADTGLARVDSGLNTPFRERPGRVDPAEWAPWRHPVLWLVVLLLLAAAAFMLVPSTPKSTVMLPAGEAADTGAAALPPPAASAEVLPAVSASSVVAEPAAPPPVAASAAVVAAAPLAAAASAPARAASEALVLHAVQATWVQLVDGKGQSVVARLIPAGETLTLSPPPPLRLRIGNAQGTELRYRGRPVELGAATRDNVANLTLP